MAPISEATVLVSERDLKTFCVSVLTRVGVSDEQATEIIEILVEADLRGVESHGVVRLPIYAERLAAGATNPRPQIRVVRETPTSLVIDGDNGMGQWVGVRAMERAISKRWRA